MVWQRKTATGSVKWCTVENSLIFYCTGKHLAPNGSVHTVQPLFLLPTPPQLSFLHHLTPFCFYSSHVYSNMIFCYNIDDGVNCLIIICGRPPYCRVLYVLPIHFFVNYIITLLIQYKKVSDSVTGDVSYCRVWCEVCGHYMSFL